MNMCACEWAFNGSSVPFKKGSFTGRRRRQEPSFWAQTNECGRRGGESKLWIMHKLVFDSESPECSDPERKAQGNTRGRKLAPGGKGMKRGDKEIRGTLLVLQWLRLKAPKARGPGSIPDQGTRSHTPQPKILHATIKIENPKSRN